MGVIARINVNRIEITMNKIIELSSKISFLQEELVHLDAQLESNKSFFSSGVLSKQAFQGNKKNFERKIKEISREINADSKVLLKLSKEAKKNLRFNKL